MVSSSSRPTIYELIASRTRQFPSGPAVGELGRQSLDYIGLLDQVHYVRHILRRAGIAQEDRVAVVLHNGPELGSAFLSVSSAAVCAPLNPAFGREEFLNVFLGLKVRALLVQQGLDFAAREAAQEQGISLIELSYDERQPAGTFTLQGPEDSLLISEADPRSDGLALILPTTGTTSHPKFVPLTHANVCAAALSLRDTLLLTERDRCINTLPLFHVHGLVASVLGSISAGGSILFLRSFTADAFFECLKHYRPSWYTAVPTIHQMILETAKKMPQPLIDCNLRFIRSASAPLPQRLLAELEQVFSVPVIEAYGMTEAPIQISSNPFPPGVRKPGSVGLPAAAEVMIMDEHGQTLPNGQVGEIVVRGPTVMREYEGNPGTNQESFQGGWLRTGDLGFLDQDGYLFIMGRLKELVNRGGQKVAPWEVDEALLEHPAVDQAVTFAIPHARLGEDVCAAVVLKKGGVASGAELRRSLARRLAEYKIPQQILIVNEIPRNATGKVQRVGLDRFFGSLLVQTDQAAPRNEIEAILLAIWQDVLGARSASGEQFGVHDNFFALGGHSLHATQLASRTRERLGTDLNVESIFQFPTIAEQAQIIESPRERGGLRPPELRLQPLQPTATGDEREEGEL